MTIPKQSLKETYYFTEDSKYILSEEDQLDWNKLTGIASLPFNPQKRSVMCGWRYNPTTELFEVAPYYHGDDGKPHHLGPEFWFAVPPLQQFTVEIVPLPITKKFRFAITSSDTTRQELLPVRPSLISRRIAAWFGGTSPAPSKVSFVLV